MDFVALAVQLQEPQWFWLAEQQGSWRQNWGFSYILDLKVNFLISEDYILSS